MPSPASDAAAPRRSPRLAAMAKLAAPSEKTSLQKSYRLYRVAVKFVALIGLVCAAFGPAYSFLVLDLLYGSKWSQNGGGPSQLSSPPRTLAVYSFFLCITAINGSTEAFLQSAISRTQLKKYNGFLVIFSGLYLALASALLRFGSVGLIAANAANMFFRSLYSIKFASSFFEAEFPARARSSSSLIELIATVSPGPLVVFALLCSTGTTLGSQYFLDIESPLPAPAWPVSQISAILPIGFAKPFLFFLHSFVGLFSLAAVYKTFRKTEHAFIFDLLNIYRKRKES